MGPHAHPATTFDPDTKYRLFLRVHSAQDLHHKSSHGAYCKLYVGDTAMLDGSQKKLVKKASSESTNSANDDADDAETHRVFRTHTKIAETNNETNWDETFEVSIVDPNTEIMSLRVKSQHRFYCPVIGTFAVYLRHLRVGEQADQWFPLHRGKKEAGKIRLRLLLTPEAAVGRGKKKRNGSDLSVDIKAALAANHEADKAIQRLVEKQLKDEEERRLRKQRGEEEIADGGSLLHLGSGRPSAGTSERSTAGATLAQQLEVVNIARATDPIALGSSRVGSRFSMPNSSSHGPSPTSPAGSAPRLSLSASTTTSDAAASAADRNRRRNDNLARSNELDANPVPYLDDPQPSRYVHALGSARGSSRSSSNNQSSARQAPLYSIPSFGPNDVTRSKRYSSSSTDSDSMTSAAEYERRIDRKLRKVRKETEKLRRIKNQLKKYIPDLTSSGSESSTSSSADERRSERGRTTNHRNSSAAPAAIAVAHPRRSNAQGEPTRVYM